ncbi:Zip-domain-containing protein [Hesseltinella vesiculosa]|uniref:Zip-domain-containing protein n=1 Tax=Hesseltinella vesiculosa TaxID=101127 RepID=A0A1X2GG93_9FUNG|nr:Zip-domain-containing protein [Hesseltinella vesiculosa]
MQPIGNTKESWLLVLISSLACTLGASVVFIDKVFPKRHTSILTSRVFLASSMALASGVLLVSSLSILLPESRTRLDSTAGAYGWFLVGAVITLALTRIIHWCTPDAIHACGTLSPTHDHCTASTSSSSIPSMAIPTTPAQLSLHATQQQPETQKLVQHDVSDYGSTIHPDAHFRFHEHSHHHHHDEEAQAPHDSLGHQHDHDHGHDHDHHHHHDSEQDDQPVDLDHDRQRYWSIGIQTAVAICIHKFPEGMIMFISSQASSSLGISVAAAMSLHNLTEGFMMALPIYYATRSRMSAFIYASLMGGLSQPLGALFGLLTLKSVNKDQEDQLFGITFGIISGMMTFITIQSMLPQAIKVDTNIRHVVIYFFVGVMLVGLTSILKAPV